MSDQKYLKQKFIGVNVIFIGMIYYVVVDI